jgi:diguanylate cyclase (GGDEF)-like protein
MDTDITEKEIGLKEEFFSVLKEKKIKTVFQPIVSLRDGIIFGYEALSRGPEGSDLYNPSLLFDLAQKFDLLWELEFLCRTRAIETAHILNSQVKLFLNVNPNVIHDVKFRQGFTKEYLGLYSINPEDIIFEITEKEAVNNILDFKKAIENYKSQSYKIAIDDAGAGYSGLNMISDINPHFIKLDMNLIRDIDKDVTKQSLVKGLAEFASISNTSLIAEGIETENELLKLIDLGIHYGQGFFIQRPSASIVPVNGDVVTVINEANNKKNHYWGNRLPDVYIGNICRSVKTLSPDIMISQVYIMIKNDCSLPGFCVTENNVVKGVITRNELYKLISGQYGYNLYSNKPVTTVMSRDFLRVDFQESIESVSKKAMQRNSDKTYDFITVTKNDEYCGIVTVKDLLEKSIQIEVNNAKHLNPLSELPGNLMIERYLEMCVASSQAYTILYIDLDNFKAYNDVYGFENGDRIIRCLTGILRKNTPPGEFLGHIGGDDFVIALSGDSAEDICVNIIKDMDNAVLSFYNQNDIDKGYIVTKNRYGIEESFPLLTISIVGVSSLEHRSVRDLSEYMAGLKKVCKQKPGSNYLIGGQPEAN